MPGYEFNEGMELAAVRQAIGDPSLLPRIARHVRPERFALPLAQQFWRLATGYVKRVGAVPTRVAILQEVRQLKNGGQPVSVEEMADFLERASEAEPVDTRYVIERVCEVEKHEAIFHALEDGMKALRTRNYDVVRNAIDAAYAIGRGDMAPGTHYRSGLAARTQRRKSQGAPPRWGTGIPDLDDLIEGLNIGEIGCVIGPTGSGKSIFLGFVALYTMAIGGNCAYISTEMSEEQVIDRQDAAVSRVMTNEIHRYADVVQHRVEAWMAKVKGAVWVKKVAKHSTMRDVEALLDAERIESGFEPDMVVLDYADEMDPNDVRRYDKRHEELVAVHEEFRDMCERRQTRGWTAAQANLSDAIEKRNPGLQDQAGAKGKAWKDDVVISIAQTPEEIKDGFIRFAVAKGRNVAKGTETGPLPTALPLGRIIAGVPWLDEDPSSA